LPLALDDGGSCLPWVAVSDVAVLTSVPDVDGWWSLESGRMDPTTPREVHLRRDVFGEDLPIELSSAEDAAFVGDADPAVARAARLDRASTTATSLTTSFGLLLAVTAAAVAGTAVIATLLLPRRRSHRDPERAS
jgi:hypothetical protein